MKGFHHITLFPSPDRCNFTRNLALIGHVVFERLMNIRRDVPVGVSSDLSCSGTKYRSGNGMQVSQLIDMNIAPTFFRQLLTIVLFC